MKNIEISRKEIAKDYAEMEVEQICKKYQICRNRFYSILDEIGIKRHRIRKPPVMVRITIKD
jgi:hypothetical protein